MKSAKTLVLAGALSLSGALSGAMVTSAEAQSSDTKPAGGLSWNGEITRTNGGHLIGNPAAEAKVTEYISYTCPHCAQFTAQGDAALKLIYIPTGKVAVEIRHLIRDPIDWTAAVLANCGEAEKFTGNHTAFMTAQNTWLTKARSATPGQKQRWRSPDRTAARKAIAADLGFEEIMAQRGYSRIETAKCLADEKAAITLVMQSMEEAKRMRVSGTPSFALNGKLLNGTHNWPTLRQNIDAYFDRKKGE